jgi:hypothetical protein
MKIMKKGKYKNMKVGLYDKGGNRKILKTNGVMKESNKNEGT